MTRKFVEDQTNQESIWRETLLHGGDDVEEEAWDDETSGSLFDSEDEFEEDVEEE